MATKSIGIQPCNEEGETKFGLIDIDPIIMNTLIKNLL